MRKELDLLDRLAARAQDYEPETVTVADAVVARLHRPERTPLLWMTISAVVATVLLLFSVGFPDYETDPLDDLFQTANFIQTEEGFE